MSKVSKFNLASLLLAGAVSLGGIGIAKLITNNAKSASADVTSAYAEEEPTIIGIGEENKATLTLEFDTPVTLTVKEGVTGQYNLALKIADRDPEAYYDFSAYIPVEGEEYPEYVYFAYNTYADAYIATFNVTAGTEIILTSYNEAAVTLDAYFTDLFMGESTDYGIYGLLINKDLSKTVQVENVTANTYIALLQTYDALAAGTTFSIQLNSGTETDLVYDANMYGYWAEITVTAETTSFTVRTSSEATVSVDVRFVDIVTVDTALPETTATTFNLNEARDFYYDATEAGYFTITTNVTTPEDAEFAITLRANPNYPIGEDIFDNTYPMYLEANQRYYFNITYTGVRLPDGTYDPDNPPAPPANASASFKIDKWEASAIELNTMVYVPVTLSESDKVEIPVHGIAGTRYNVNLSSVPFDVEEVYIHYAGEVITVKADTGFAGEITLENADDTIYFTSNYDRIFTASAGLTYTLPEYDDRINLDTLTSITLRPGETLLYIVYDLPEGEYKITLTGTNGNVVVGDAYDNTLIAQGSNEGFFNITLAEYMPSLSEYLYFTNNGTSDITFNVLVNVTPVKTLELGQPQSITLGAGETQNYEIALDAGLYAIILEYSEGAQIEVYLNGEKIVLEEGIYENRLPSGIYVLSFTNTANTAVTFTVTVSD